MCIPLLLDQIKTRQVIEAGGDKGVIGAKHLLRGKERLLVQRFRIVIPTLFFEERTQVVLSVSETRMDWPKRVYPNGAGAHKEPLSLGVFVPFPVECCQVCQASCEEEGAIGRHRIVFLKHPL